MPGVFFSGLRTRDGKWISIIGGWMKGANMFILLQLNDARYAKESVSIVLRGYVIEKAIDTSTRRMKFIAGCEGALKKYCRLRISHLVVQRKSYPKPTQRRESSVGSFQPRKLVIYSPNSRKWNQKASYFSHLKIGKNVKKVSSHL